MDSDTAKRILGLSFGGDVRERMHALSTKASDGALTDSEQDELDAYERAGHYLALLKSKARRWLGQPPEDQP